MVELLLTIDIYTTEAKRFTNFWVNDLFYSIFISYGKNTYLSHTGLNLMKI